MRFVDKHDPYAALSSHALHMAHALADRVMRVAKINALHVEWAFIQRSFDLMTTELPPSEILQVLRATENADDRASRARHVALSCAVMLNHEKSEWLTQERAAQIEAACRVLERHDVEHVTAEQIRQC